MIYKQNNKIKNGEMWVQDVWSGEYMKHANKESEKKEEEKK